MRRLMLLRHAKTEHDAPSGRDQDRRLDNHGRHDAAEIGRFIGRNPPFPDLVLVSHAVRAHQTWEIAWEAMKELAPAPQVELTPELYGADVSQLLETIRNASVSDPKRLMLVGHNPGMEVCAGILARDPVKRKEKDALGALEEKFPTCALAILDFDLKRWRDIEPRTGVLIDFVRPRDL